LQAASGNGTMISTPAAQPSGAYAPVILYPSPFPGGLNRSSRRRKKPRKANVPQRRRDTPRIPRGEDNYSAYGKKEKQYDYTRTEDQPPPRKKRCDPATNIYSSQAVSQFLDSLEEFTESTTNRIQASELVEVTNLLVKVTGKLNAYNKRISSRTPGVSPATKRRKPNSDSAPIEISPKKSSEPILPATVEPKNTVLDLTTPASSSEPVKTKEAEKTKTPSFVPVSFGNFGEKNNSTAEAEKPKSPSIEKSTPSNFAFGSNEMKESEKEKPETTTKESHGSLSPVSDSFTKTKGSDADPTGFMGPTFTFGKDPLDVAKKSDSPVAATNFGTVAPNTQFGKELDVAKKSDSSVPTNFDSPNFGTSNFGSSNFGSSNFGSSEFTFGNDKETKSEKEKISSPQKEKIEKATTTLPTPFSFGDTSNVKQPSASTSTDSSPKPSKLLIGETKRNDNFPFLSPEAKKVAEPTETEKPGEADKPVAPTFTFETPKTTNETPFSFDATNEKEKASKPSGFVFGNPKETFKAPKSDTSGKSPIKFGADTHSGTSAFAFGSNPTPTAPIAANTFSFGSAATPGYSPTKFTNTTKTPQQTGNFSFGQDNSSSNDNKGQSQPTFSFGSATPAFGTQTGSTFPNSTGNPFPPTQSFGSTSGPFSQSSVGSQGSDIFAFNSTSSSSGRTSSRRSKKFKSRLE